MAEDTHSGGNGWLAFIVGGLIVVVAVLGYMFYANNGSFSTAQRDVDVKIEAPNIEAPKLPEAPELPAPNVPAPPAPAPQPQ